MAGEKKGLSIWVKIAIVVVALIIIGAVFGKNDEKKEEPQAKAPVQEQIKEQPKEPVRDEREVGLEKRLSYLKDLPEVAWVRIESNTVYIGFKSASSKIGSIVRAAAFQGNKAIDFGTHVWAVEAKNKDWRPGDGPYYCTASARSGKVTKSDCN